MVYDFRCPVTDVVHALYPLHLIPCFKLFGDALLHGHLLCQLEHLLLRLFIDVGKVGIQPAANQQLRIQGLALLLDISQVPLPPNTNGLCSLPGTVKQG